MGLRDFTLADVIARNAVVHRDKIAFVADGKRITHGEYAARVERLAAGLATNGLVSGDRIAVLAQNCLEYVDLYGAAARLGLIMVPVNWRLAAEEIAYVIADTTPKVIVASTDYQVIIEAARDRFPSVQRFFSLGEATGMFVRYGELISANGVAPEVDVPADSGYVIIHTAAVGGRPRGALLSHAGLIAAHAQLLHYWNLGPQDVNLGVLPLFHLTGLSLTLAVQQGGGASVVMPRFEPEAVLRMIQAEKVTLFGEFPPMLTTLLDKVAQGDCDLSSLRVLTGLDTPETIARFEAAYPQARFWAAYGQSELSGLVTMAPYRERPGSAGQPILCSRVALVNDLDQPLPPGQIGEIVVRGPMVFNGYWNCEADNALTFRNGWHHTGDLGRLDDQGYLWYAGRSPAKELIKPGGENVYPAEVEKTILEHSAIAEVVVLGVPDAQWGEAIKAVCVCCAGQHVTAAELIEFVGARIARFKRPKLVTFVDALPKTVAGEIDRTKVKQEHASA